MKEKERRRKEEGKRREPENTKNGGMRESEYKDIPDQERL